jgi:hypothetical protein
VRVLSAPALRAYKKKWGDKRPLNLLKQRSYRFFAFLAFLAAFFAFFAMV